VPELTDWFLTTNRAEPLIHGATYFDHLITEVEAMRAGDYLFFTDWRGDPDEKMRDDGPTIVELFISAAERGVVVNGLMWRSHLGDPLPVGRLHQIAQHSYGLAMRYPTGCGLIGPSGSAGLGVRTSAGVSSVCVPRTDGAFGLSVAVSTGISVRQCPVSGFQNPPLSEQHHITADQNPPPGHL
jgi:hypothetical protein